MAPPGTSEGQDGSVESRSFRNPLSRASSSFAVTDGVYELRSLNRNKPTRFVSLEQTDGSANGEKTVPFVLKRSVSAFEVRNERQVPAATSLGSSAKAEIQKKRDIGPKNGKMVLHLVLPNNNRPDDGSYERNGSVEEFFGETNASPRSIGSQQEIYSTAGTECYVNGAYTNDLDDYGRPYVQSPISLASTPDGKPTDAETRSKLFKKYLTKTLSFMYALFVVTLGIVVYISDIIITRTSLAEAFSLYLVVVSLIFIVYLTVDVKLYVIKKRKYHELLEKSMAEEIEMKESPAGDFQLNIKLPEALKLEKLEKLEHHYCFSKDRHAANFYLKIGAAVFCVGHLIHSGLLLGYQIIFLTSDGGSIYECATEVTVVLDILYPIYSFLLLYFMFKYSNIIINRHVATVRFGLMHCISASLCFWLWTILRETVEALSNHDYEEEEKEEDASREEHRSPSEVAFYTGQPVALPLASYNKRGAQLLKAYLNSSIRQFVGECGNDAGMSTIYRNYSPYLYPFSVEYSILVVGVLVVIWQNIGTCKEKEEMSSERQCSTPGGNSDNLENNIVIHADCHSANKGLFSGIVIMVLTVVSIILFLIAINDEARHSAAINLSDLTSIMITSCMSAATIIAYRQITKLDISDFHISFLDDLLLIISLPAFFLNGIVVLIPAIGRGLPLGITVVVFEVLQILIQTPFIIDGLRRCSNTKELRRAKPGRELLTFLIVCNLAIWIMQTFEVKSHDLKDQKYEYYGVELWTILGHLCVPLMMFYRFHSSVCLVDIWKYAYEPGEKH